MEIFDRLRHHFGLGPRDGSQYGFLLTGGYNRDLQRYGTPSEFGGTQDQLGTPNLARWTQDDWSGGFGQYAFKDAAMFADSRGLLPIHGSSILRTVPPVVVYVAPDQVPPVDTIGVDGAIPILFHATRDALHCVFRGGYIKFSKTESNGSLATIQTVDAPVGDAGSWECAAVDNTLAWPVMMIVNNATKKIERYEMEGSIGPRLDPADWPFHTLLASSNILHIEVGASYYTLDVDGVLYTLNVPDNHAAPVDADWTKIGRLPGRWKDSITYNGWVYILCASDDARTTLVAFDGNDILPITDLPYNFAGECLTSYGGRIFVGGAGLGVGNTTSYAQLYEVTGASVRLVKTFAPESRTSGTYPDNIYSMAVYEGLLFFGHSGHRMIAYDITTDSFHGGFALQNPDGQRQFRHIATADEKVWTWLHHPLDDFQDGVHRVALPADAGGLNYTPYLITSDFAVEPDRHKRFSKLAVLSRYGGVQLGYSTDGGAPGGDTFDALPVTTTVEGDLYHTVADLSALDPAKQIRFRIQVPRGNNVTGFVELIAMTASFVFLDTGKWSWSFTVNGSERVEDASALGSEVQATGEIRENLAAWARDRTPLTYTDLDGNEYNVQILNFRESQPVIGEADDDGNREAFYQLSLIEV